MEARGDLELTAEVKVVIFSHWSCH